jgi:hypothetical protein
MYTSAFCTTAVRRAFYVVVVGLLVALLGPAAAVAQTSIPGSPSSSVPGVPSFQPGTSTTPFGTSPSTPFVGTVPGQNSMSGPYGPTTLGTSPVPQMNLGTVGNGVGAGFVPSATAGTTSIPTPDLAPTAPFTPIGGYNVTPGPVGAPSTTSPSTPWIGPSIGSTPSLGTSTR